jgi:hypothetical protein
MMKAMTSATTAMTRAAVLLLVPIPGDMDIELPFSAARNPVGTS